MLKNEIHQRISWNWENISKDGPQSYDQKLWKIQAFNAKVHRIQQNLTEAIFRFFARYYDAEESDSLAHFLKLRKYLQYMGPILGQKCMKNWIFNEKVASDPQNLTEPIFRYFGTYYDAEKEIHLRVSWNWENISKDGPKIRPTIMKNSSL